MTQIAGAALGIGSTFGAFNALSSGRSITATSSLGTTTPAFNLQSGTTATGPQTTLTRLGSDPQNEFGARFPRSLADIDTLRGTVTPGFSDLRRARLAQISNARDRSIGNLRDNLARRRVQGSSFANASLAQSEREFGEAFAGAEAQSFLEELAANQQLLTLENSFIADALQRELTELGIAAQQSLAFGQLTQQAAQFDQQQRMIQALAKTQIFGTLAGLGFSMALGGSGGGGGGGLGSLGGLFGGGAESAAGAGVGQSVVGGEIVGAGAAAAASSRLFKTDNRDLESILQAVHDLPVERWRYKGSSDDKGHIGPYAEDFQEAFDVGDGVTIQLQDALGVALGAIKELTIEVWELKARLEERDG